MINEGSSEMDGRAEWARYMSASSPAEILAYEVFIMAMDVHENELLEENVARADEALRFKTARDNAREKLLENRRRAAAGETAEMRAQAALVRAAPVVLGVIPPGNTSTTPAPVLGAVT